MNRGHAKEAGGEGPSSEEEVSTPLLSCAVAHWHCESDLERLVAAWPTDPRFELIVVDNGSRRPLARSSARIVEPMRNLGFAGATNLAVEQARAPIVLLLNPDTIPEVGSLESLLEGFERYPDAAGLAPSLRSESGSAQYRWQLRHLPTPGLLLLETLLIPVRRGAEPEPGEGARVEQPAAAALALRRQVLLDLGGLDEDFFPAWFEDVDLARRLRDAGHVIRYWPAARFSHRLGSSLEPLGYGPFLWIYYRNLVRYLSKHHGSVWAQAARALLPLGMILRLLALAVRKPQRAAGRIDAARGLAAVALGAWSDWRRPREYATVWQPGTQRTAP